MTGAMMASSAVGGMPYSLAPASYHSGRPIRLVNRMPATAAMACGTRAERLVS